MFIKIKDSAGDIIEVDNRSIKCFLHPSHVLYGPNAIEGWEFSFFLDGEEFCFFFLSEDECRHSFNNFLQSMEIS